MDIKVDLSTKPLDEIIERLPKLNAVVGKVASDVLARALAAINSGPKSGKIYKRGKKVHQASASGQAPANDKGFLALSGFAKPVKPGLWRVGFTASYARLLEEVKERPFLSPALRFVADPLQRAIEAVFKTKE